MEGLGGKGRGGFIFHFKITDTIKCFLKSKHIYMINDHKILQSHLIYFRKTCYIIRNLKKKIEPSPLFPF